jgi:hypothetical protein
VYVPVQRDVLKRKYEKDTKDAPWVWVGVAVVVDVILDTDIPFKRVMLFLWGGGGEGTSDCE